MEPFDINAGRFYLRALHNQTTLDDGPTLRSITPTPAIQSNDEAEDGWMNNTCYSWAVCEQTSSDLLALVTYEPATDTVTSYPAGEADTVWDHNRELEPITLGQAAATGEKAVRAHI
ncbi:MULTISPECIES: hypothetical protein [Corynebacterium]|uniref:hypothetical protein n=1 Tax=Corynebacterium TaxID=1716 RepID=UPI00124EF69E|nr:MULTISPECIES: hypothetical protein [Corynebacterium]